MKRGKLYFISIFIFIGFVGTGLLVEFLTTPAPTAHRIHIEAFRYGTSPSIIRASRGDKLTFTFSTRDTGHSFFLQEYGIDAKIEPAFDEVLVYNPFDPSLPPIAQKEIRLTAGLPGAWGSLFSLARYRCHVYCGRMHGFEQGSLIVRPNWLFALSLSLLAALSLVCYVRVRFGPPMVPLQSGFIDLNKRSRLLDRILKARPLQFVLTTPVLGVFILLILAGFFGTKVGGRNIAVMVTWAAWMFLITVFLVPVGGRIWCLLCPLPVLGEYIQRGATTQVRTVKDNPQKNKYFGLGLAWPKLLKNPWLRIFSFLIIGTFSASLAGQPKWTARVLLLFIILAVLISFVFSRRAFCMYICPVSTFLSLYSPVGRIQVRARSLDVCKACRDKPCYSGNENGWGCPYELVVPAVTRNMDCGICTECFKSCPYGNVSLGWRKGAWLNFFRNEGEAFQAIVMMTLAIAYSLTIHSPWPKIRDMVNVVDKVGLLQFGTYVLVLWTTSFLFMPLILRALTRLGMMRAGYKGTSPEAFKKMAQPLIPLGLSFWAAFFIAMFMPNITFILVTLSDPFGWGWDIFGTARLPWIQLWPHLVPWIQAALVLAGFFFSLRRGYLIWLGEFRQSRDALRVFFPVAAFLVLLSAGMITYFTNF